MNYALLSGQTAATKNWSIFISSVIEKMKAELPVAPAAISNF